MDLAKVHSDGTPLRSGERSRRGSMQWEGGNEKDLSRAQRSSAAREKLSTDHLGSVSAGGEEGLRVGLKVKRIADRQKTWCLLLCFVGVFVGNLQMSFIAPFFPDEAKAEGYSSVEIGTCFACFGFAAMLCSPLAGYFMPTQDCYWMLTLGFALDGTGALCFAFTRSIGVWSLIRVVQGLGVAISYTATVSCISALYADQLSRYMAMLESVVGLTYVFGPALGSLLYWAGGFELPFIVSGLLLSLWALIVYFGMSRDLVTSKRLVSEDDSADAASEPAVGSAALSDAVVHTKGGAVTPVRELPPTCSFLRSGRVWAACGLTFFSTFVFGVFDPSILLYLNREVGATPMGVGALCVMVGVVNMVACGYWGYVIDSHQAATSVAGAAPPKDATSFIGRGAAAGLLMVGFGWLFLGPLLQGRLFMAIMAAILLAAGYGLSVVSTLPLLMYECCEVVAAHNPALLISQQDPVLSSRVSGIFSFLFYGGFAFGPLYAGGMQWLTSYQRMYLTSACLYAGFAVLLYAVFVSHARPPRHNIVNAERTTASDGVSDGVRGPKSMSANDDAALDADMKSVDGLYDEKEGEEKRDSDQDSDQEPLLARHRGWRSDSAGE